LLHHLKNIASDVTGSSGSSQNWYITAERAEGIHSKDTFSKSDAYLTIEFGGKKVRTRSIKNDLSPSWNETFNFKIPSNSAKDILLTLTDDDFGFDDSIGKATVSKSDLPIQPGEEKCLKIPVYKKEKVNGVVHIRVKHMLDGQSSSQQSQQPVYHQSQQPMYNQPQQPMNNQSQQPMYNQSQPPPYYNQNPQFQGQGPPMSNQPQQQQQPYSNQPYSQQQQPYSNQPNPNYRGNQY